MIVSLIAWVHFPAVAVSLCHHVQTSVRKVRASKLVNTTEFVIDIHGFLNITVCSVL
jgi:hypothetical protein